MSLEAMQAIPAKMWQWLKDQIAQDVPEADALCEYDCRKQQCVTGEWAACERRIQKAAGELWPEPKRAVSAPVNAGATPPAPPSSENAGLESSL